MFHVTLVHLAPDARSAHVDQGSARPRRMEAAELTALLENFRELDPVQNHEAEPQIVVECPRGRFTIHTGQRKLFFYNVRQFDEPALTLEIPEIIAELDGSAAAARNLQILTATPFPLDELAPAESAYPTPPPRPRSRRPWVMAAAALALGGLLSWLHQEAPPPDAAPAPVPITDPTALVSTRASVVGVYLTGNEPGHHGIALLADGTLKLFQIQSVAAPSVLFGTFQMARRDQKLCLLTDQPGGPMELPDSHTLLFCGETYHRVP